jgi:uncharacterized protein
MTDLPGAASRAMFHAAVPVDDLDRACDFYGRVLECRPGRRRTGYAADYVLFGHHLVLQLVPGEVAARQRAASGAENAAWRHLGIVVSRDRFDRVWARLRAEGVVVAYGPEFRGEGEPGAEALVLVCDPSGNVLEFKGVDDEAVVLSGARHDCG